MSHLLWAKELMEKYPKETAGFTVQEVMDIWEDYSDMFAAGWLEPANKQDEVEDVFKRYRSNK